MLRRYRAIAGLSLPLSVVVVLYVMRQPGPDGGLWAAKILPNEAVAFAFNRGGLVLAKEEPGNSSTSRKTALTRLTPQFSASAIAYSDDAKLLAAIVYQQPRAGRQVMIWKSESDELLGRVDVDATAINFRKGPAHLIMGCADGDIVEYSVQQEAIVATSHVHTRPVEFVVPAERSWSVASLSAGSFVAEVDDRRDVIRVALRSKDNRLLAELPGRKWLVGQAGELRVVDEKTATTHFLSLPVAQSVECAIVLRETSALAIAGVKTAGRPAIVLGVYTSAARTLKWDREWEAEMVLDLAELSGARLALLLRDARRYYHKVVVESDGTPVSDDIVQLPSTGPTSGNPHKTLWCRFRELVTRP